MADTVKWIGASGESYTYWVHPVGEDFKDEPGNYIFAKVVGGKWSAIYIGETASLKKRPLGPGHEKWNCAERNGVTHIHAHTTPGGVAARQDEESDLLANRNPPCNG